MPQKLAALFFSTAKKMARLQRVAWGLSTPAPKRRRKKVPLAKGHTSAPGLAGAISPDAAGISGYAGNWRSFIYRTPPLLGAWPVRLSYTVYTPPSAGTGSPLVVMLHGCEQTALDLARGTRMHRLADLEGFLIAYPQQSRRGQRNRCWHWFQPDTAHGYAEADAIAGVISEVVARQALDPARVYIAGLSAGAGMAAMVALRHPGLVAALGMHSGTVVGDAHSATEGFRTMRRGTVRPPAELLEPLLADPPRFPGMPAVIVQGERDTVVYACNGRQLLEQFAGLNGVLPASASAERIYAAGTRREYLRIDVPAGRAAVVQLCQVKALGHAWSGGDGAVKFHAGEGPDASLLMWRFFKGRRRA